MNTTRNDFNIIIMKNQDLQFFLKISFKNIFFNPIRNDFDICLKKK